MTAAPFSPWLVSRRFDLAVFVVPALLSVLLATLGSRIAEDGATPAWAWLVFVVGIDVAHVHGTTLRVYCDSTELRRRIGLYAGVPLAAFVVGALAYGASPLWFWRALAYLALFHFVRQQVGWVRLYRHRAGDASRLDARLDEATVYAATLYPVIVWHTRLPETRFDWFVQGDFLTGLQPVAADGAEAIWAALLIAFAARQVQRKLRGDPLPYGKIWLVFTTALTWWVGIVWFATDFAFTVTNVVAHGVPYMFMSQRVRAAGSQAPQKGLLWQLTAYLAMLLALAFVEEWLWDVGVWQEHADIFPTFPLDVAMFGPLLVPLLAVPQITHYVLDAYLWRLDGHNPGVARVIGASLSRNTGELV